MRILIGIVAFIIWTFVSIQWYVCGIKELCKDKITYNVPIASENLPVDTTVKEQTIIKDEPSPKFRIDRLNVYFPFAKSETDLHANLIDSMNMLVQRSHRTHFKPDLDHHDLLVVAKNFS